MEEAPVSLDRLQHELLRRIALRRKLLRVLHDFAAKLDLKKLEATPGLAKGQLMPMAIAFDQSGLLHTLAVRGDLGRSGTNLSQPARVVVLDLDRFKRINETWGHSVGDQLLIAVSARLTRSVRTADYVTRSESGPVAGNLARLGGDEFTIQVTGLAQAADVAKVARRILSVLAQPFDVAAGRTTGPAFPIAERIDQDPYDDGFAMFALAGNGVLAYRGGVTADRQFRWFDREGRRLGELGWGRRVLAVPD